MTRDDEAFRMLAAAPGAEARPAPPKKPPGNGRGRGISSDATEEMRAPGIQPPEPPTQQYPDIPSQVETGPTPLAKRWLDMGVAGLMVGVLWPVFGLAALLIKLESPGPVMIKQKRVGLDGKTFYFYKYRSMHDRKKADDLPERLPTGDLKKRLLSPRGRPLNATAVGWTLRKTTVDELPQLLNVVRGEMSLVGPRPDIPEIVDHWPPEFRQRHQVKPGMTGLAQVNGRSDLTHYEKVKYDLRYVRHHPITCDLRILLKTIGLVISKKGAR
jgi:lipopolysaccharide/colanic/teichoic acid biosynthesis glycosyltransferase